MNVKQDNGMLLTSDTAEVQGATELDYSGMGLKGGCSCIIRCMSRYTPLISCALVSLFGIFLCTGTGEFEAGMKAAVPGCTVYC